MNKQENNYNLTNTMLFHLEQTARISRISAMHYFENNPEINISYNDFSIIDAIFLNPEIHQRDLAKLLAKDTANLSRDLERLEKQGFLIRIVDTKGKRVVKKLVLTNSGEYLRSSITKIAKSHVEKLESIFTEKEKEIFKEYLMRLKNNL